MAHSWRRIWLPTAPLSPSPSLPSHKRCFHIMKISRTASVIRSLMDAVAPFYCLPTKWQFVWDQKKSQFQQQQPLQNDLICRWVSLQLFIFITHRAIMFLFSWLFKEEWWQGQRSPMACLHIGFHSLFLIHCLIPPDLDGSRAQQSDTELFLCRSVEILARPLQMYSFFLVYFPPCLLAFWWHKNERVRESKRAGAIYRWSCVYSAKGHKLL